MFLGDGFRVEVLPKRRVLRLVRSPLVEPLLPDPELPLVVGNVGEANPSLVLSHVLLLLLVEPFVVLRLVQLGDVHDLPKREELNVLRVTFLPIAVLGGPLQLLLELLDLLLPSLLRHPCLERQRLEVKARLLIVHSDR